MKQKVKQRNSFKKGDQCVQNPDTKKFRNQVKKNVFTHKKSQTGLTLAALEKHNEKVEDELDIGDLAISEKTGTSVQSKAFSIGGLTDCSNMTFSKVMDHWNSGNIIDQEKCAILAAVTEVIRSKGGSETESEYFAALMTVLEASKDNENSIVAILYLLNLVIKRIPTTLLKARFSEVSKLLLQVLEKYSVDGKTSLVACALDCLTTTLSAQESAVWMESSTQHCFQIMLRFTTHSKPKIRKLAHNSVKNITKINLINHQNHPIGTAITNFCVHILAQHTSENAAISHHVLNLLKLCIQYLGAESLKEICEAILRMLTINNPIIKTNSMQTLHALCTANPPEENFSAELNAKLISALYDFQPSINDPHVTNAWLALMLAAHSNLSLINEKSCLKLLPRFYGTAMTYFTSDHREVTKAAADIMKETSEKCLEPIMDTIEEDIKRKDSSFCKIFKLIESGLRYKYQPVWDIVLQSLQYLYSKFGKQCASVMINSVTSLIDLHASPAFPFMSSLNRAIGAAFKTFGPQMILNERPLKLVRQDDQCDFPLAWLLPVMKDCIQNTQLAFFISYFLPMAATLRGKALKCRESKQDLEAKVYETLVTQIWALLPGFCTNPTDLKESFKSIAKILGTALMERNDLRPLVLLALRTLINRTLDEEELTVIGKFAKNYMPILFNLYTSNDENCKAISLSILETIKAFLIVAESTLVQTFVKKIFEKLKEEDSAEKRHLLMDLAVCMVKYSTEEQVRGLYQLVTGHVQDKDKSMQKKAYRILEEICSSNSESCKNLVEEKFDELMSVLVDSLSSAVPSSKAPRLGCISSLVKKLSNENKDFLQVIIPEVILCTKEVGVKAKTAAFDLLVDIGSSYVFLSTLPKEECIEQYFHFVMAGLAGSPHMISATLLAFTKLVFEYRYCISAKLVATLLDAAITLLKSKTREVIKSCLLFIRAVVKILDANELSGHLESLIKNLFVWNTQNSSAYRQQIRRILEKLDKKCGYHLVKSLVPNEHKRFIVQIHKTIERTKRQREAYRNSKNNSEESEDETTKETTWDDVLADSDEEENEDKKKIKQQEKKQKKSKHAKTWIVENEEGVDLLDPTVAKNIVATKPKHKKMIKHDFSFSSDGKIVVKDEDQEIENNDEAALDVGEKDILGGYDKTPKQIKLGKRKRMEDMPEDENVFQKYEHGGIGIHRHRDADDSAKKKLGADYKAKKAGGDMKLKGKPDPYAYIPLDRQKLNKRKKAKLSGQFHGMVKATRKGAAAANKYKKKRK
ncbi:RRP12-like protein [Hydractinia symbiolongicarpus]|uniref:RRP12-like protein n=1 Tax=Hydractinia symbiolongicarpus TaxID=13093 RepID=UPI00254F803B|nr:RRP12-like protein [Hydractinia symbiolongicarpus]